MTPAELTAAYLRGEIKTLDELVEAAMVEGARRMRGAATRTATGPYKSHSDYDPRSPLYGMDMTPDRSDFGRGKQAGRDLAQQTIATLDPAEVVKG